MKRVFGVSVMLVMAGAAGLWAAAPAPGGGAGGPVGPAPLVSGWVELKEGEGAGTVEVDAKHATNTNPHLLKIAVTKYPDAGKGRYGVKNSAPMAVKEGAAYDIQFGGISEGIGVGLVFSLETDEGKVLARTTLPEIGRGGGGRGRRGGAAGSAPASGPATVAAGNAPAWRRYLVSLTARGSAANAHLTITPIEQVPVWIENLTVVERPQAK